METKLNHDLELAKQITAQAKLSAAVSQQLKDLDAKLGRLKADEAQRQQDIADLKALQNKINDAYLKLVEETAAQNNDGDDDDDG